MCTPFPAHQTELIIFAAIFVARFPANTQHLQLVLQFCSREFNWVFTRSDRRTDRSVRLVCPTGRTDGRKNQTCLISSDCRSDCRSVWTLRLTGRTDWPVGRPITVQRRRYYNQLAGHIDVIDRCGRFGYSLSDRSDRQSDVAWVGPTGRSNDRNV